MTLLNPFLHEKILLLIDGQVVRLNLGFSSSKSVIRLSRTASPDTKVGWVGA